MQRPCNYKLQTNLTLCSLAVKVKRETRHRTPVKSECIFPGAGLSLGMALWQTQQMVGPPGPSVPHTTPTSSERETPGHANNAPNV